MKRIASACAVFLLTVWTAMTGTSGTGHLVIPEMQALQGGADTASFQMLNATQADLYIGNLHARGSLFDVRQEGLVIVTARHLFDHARERDAENADRVRVVFCNGKQAEGTLLGADSGSDIAFVSVEAGQLTEETVRGTASVRTPDTRAAQTAAGDTVLAVGGSDDFRTGMVAYESLFVASAGGDMLCCYLDAERGMSGGGVFDLSGTLLGVISMGSDANEALATPADRVHRAYQTLE
ncbi:MAG: trypsin-like peptidase domain-containing protein [Lachnospiraceae bacterium]|nr:trypsin-like peptidase domain-containing protein [Lachnospiraceae bacterium]